MLYWAAVFFIIALVAAVFGFGGIAVGAAEIAKILFVVFLVLFIVSLLVEDFVEVRPFSWLASLILRSDRLVPAARRRFSFSPRQMTFD